MFGNYDTWKATDPRDNDLDAAYGPLARPGVRMTGWASSRNEPCCVCCDGGEGPPCSPDCARIYQRGQAVKKVRRYRDLIRHARRLVRQYVAEGDGMASGRILATLARIGELRTMLHTAVGEARGR